jgi:hypothetical protein
MSDVGRGPELEFYDDTGTHSARFSATATGSTLYLGKAGGRASAFLNSGTSDRPTPSLLLGNVGENSILLEGGNMNAVSMFGSAGSLRLDVENIVGGPSVTVKDKEGYSSVIGRSDLVVTATGKKEQTPAASLVLFDKEKKVLWAAP